jgi:hypothetical protein
MNIKIGKGGSGKLNSTKGGSGKLNEKKYIDLLPPNFISKVTLSGGGVANGVYTRSSGETATFNGEAGRYIEWQGSSWGLYEPSIGDIAYSSFNLINWYETSADYPPTGVTQNALTFLFDPIFYKKEIQNERYKILLQGCSLTYVNGIYSQTVNPSLVNNRPAFTKDDDTDMIIFDDGGEAWIIRDSNERNGYYNLFIKTNYCGSSISCYPDQLDWSTPDDGDAVGNETPPTITQYLNLTEGKADLDPVYLEELRNYQINGIIPTFPNLNVRQHIPGASFNTRKAEFANNVYRYIKYNNNDDVEHLKKYGPLVYGVVNTSGPNGASYSRGKNLQDLIDPLLKLRKNDSSAIFAGNQDYTLNMFIKLQRPVSHTSPTNYIVREKRGIFLTSYPVGSYDRPLIIGYRSPYYNIDGDTTYKLKFEPFSFVFSFGLSWTPEFGYANFCIMTDYKYKFGEMYMLSISRQSSEFKIYINGEQQTTALLPFNPCVIPSSSNCRSRRQYSTRKNMTPLAPGFLKKDGSAYTTTSTSWSLASAGGGDHAYLCFGKSRRSGVTSLDNGPNHHHRRKRYLNNLDIGVINSYNIALSQTQISEIYNNFRYRYI